MVQGTPTRRGPTAPTSVPLQSPSKPVSTDAKRPKEQFHGVPGHRSSGCGARLSSAFDSRRGQLETRWFSALVGSQRDRDVNTIHLKPNI